MCGTLVAEAARGLIGVREALMAEIRVPLADETAAQLRSFASKRGQSPEEAVQSLIESALQNAELPQVHGTLSRIFGMASIEPIDWSKHDELIADDAMSSHEKP